MEVTFLKTRNEDRYEVYDPSGKVVAEVRKEGETWIATVGDPQVRFTSANFARTYVTGFFAGRDEALEQTRGRAARGEGVSVRPENLTQDPDLASVGNPTADQLPQDPTEGEEDEPLQGQTQDPPAR